MIKILGASEEPNYKESVVTHFIISPSNIKHVQIIFNNLSKQNKHPKIVNLKWIIHSFFNLSKMNELDEAYKININ